MNKEKLLRLSSLVYRALWTRTMGAPISEAEVEEAEYLWKEAETELKEVGE